MLTSCNSDVRPAINLFVASEFVVLLLLLVVAVLLHIVVRNVSFSIFC